MQGSRLENSRLPAASRPPQPIALALLAASVLSLAAAPRASGQAPTFCVESIRQSTEGFERLTLFQDGTLVRKTSRDGQDRLEKHEIPSDERTFYCDFYARAALWAEPGDWRSMIASGMNTYAFIVVTRPDGSRKEFRFDELSVLSPEVGALRASIEGLRSAILSPLAPVSRFDRVALPAGTLLRRFDGAVFRVRRHEDEKDIVELEGVNDPFSFFVQREELRFQFEPPPRLPPTPTPGPESAKEKD